MLMIHIWSWNSTSPKNVRASNITMGLRIISPHLVYKQRGGILSTRTMYDSMEASIKNNFLPESGSAAQYEVFDKTKTNI